MASAASSSRWIVWYKETEDLWRKRYVVLLKQSVLMEQVMRAKGMDGAVGDHILGLFAARRYGSKEVITVYVGDDIGAAEGELVDYHGYHVMERMERDDGVT